MKLNNIMLAVGISSALALAPIQGIASGTSAQDASNEVTEPELKPAASKYKTINLDIGGMVCSSCSNGVTASLKDINGVIKSNISHVGNEGTIVYDPMKLNEKKILKAIGKSGFKATIKKPKDSKKTESETMSG
jgi:copper chaperone CopZ